MGEMILPNATEERRLVLNAVQKNMPCQAIHICDEQPDNVKIWLNEVESHGSDSEFWVMNKGDKVDGEQIDRCPYCGAELKCGAGDVAIVVDDPPESEENSDNSENDVPEEQQEPCDWKNASGADDDEDETEDEPDEVSGEPLDLRGNEFDFIVNPANAALNRFVAMLHAKKQHDGEINIKVTFEDDGGSYIFGGAVSGKINLTMKPQKVTGDAVELQFDAQGNPIIPADREHQLNFDEIQPGQREYPPSGGTAMVDGKTGIVESYEAVQNDKPEDDSPEKELYPCENIGCPFYRVADAGESGCYYYPTKDADTFDVNEAVEENGCTRPEILQAYADAQPQEDDESEENSNE